MNNLFQTVNLNHRALHSWLICGILALFDTIKLRFLCMISFSSDHNDANSTIHWTLSSSKRQIFKSKRQQHVFQALNVTISKKNLSFNKLYT
ncbi:hypothetical protein DAHU10_035740 [Hanseniaspora uvarum]|nr:hypothetical protein DAHU10_035740 [Hanseniaspora uvarum]